MVTTFRAITKNPDPDWGCYISVGLLFCFCCVRGYWLISHLSFPPYSDSLRDIGFIQGILDGNLFGDPNNAGAWRWYPPLIPSIFAAAVKLTGIDPLTLWLNTAPWINLLAPATFFLLSKNLVGVPAATFATFAFVLLNGALIPPWDTATYAPWPYTPILAEAFFYTAVLVIYYRIDTSRLFDALLIGTATGITFLAHAIPGLILISIVGITAVVVNGLRFKTLIWLAIAWGVAGGLAFLLMGPLIVEYHLHVLNTLTVPGASQSELYLPGQGRMLRALVHLPFALALVAIAVLSSRNRGFTPSVLDRKVVAILGAWFLGCFVPLGRHFLCWPIPNGHPACDTLALPIQHFHVYLQAAEAVVLGYAAFLLYRRLFELADGWRLWAGKVIFAAVALWGGVAFLTRSNDNDMVRRVASGKYLDFDLYRWVVANTQPIDLFVTDLPDDFSAPAAEAVFTAGRRLIATLHIHSNPYLDWTERNRQRLRYYLAAISDSDVSRADLCQLAREAGKAASAYVILPIDLKAANLLGTSLFQSRQNAVFRIDDSRCR
jgi:hypothetical protein